MMFSMAGHRAVVTGGAGGIGAAISEAFVDAGAHVIIMSRSDAANVVADRLNERVDATTGSWTTGDTPVKRGRADAVQADLGDPAELASGFAAAVEVLGGIDVLVTCHGAVAVGDATELSLDEWQRVIQVNLTATFALCQLAAREMFTQRQASNLEGARHQGKIITVASMYAFFGGVKVAAYTASKGGVAQLTKALANEWASQDINVNCIAPGYVRTDLNRHVWEDPQRCAEIVSRLPAGRWAEPADLKGPAVFLASGASDYLHGVILPVDGGFLVR